jgi:hypothetical protein
MKVDADPGRARELGVLWLLMLLLLAVCRLRGSSTFR